MKSSSTAPKVSILTPCFNGEKYLHKLLDSILNQNYQALEFIIVDDGSEDNSLSILNEYREKFKNKHIEYRVIAKNNGGAASAINEGLKYFTGDYLTFIDADDFLNEDSIQKRVDFLEKNKNFDAVYSDTDVVEDVDYYNIVDTLRDESNSKQKNLFMNMLLNSNYIWTPAYFIRAPFFKDINQDLHISEAKAGQNIQLFLPLWHRAVVGYLNESLVTIVRHSDSHSRTVRDDRTNIFREREIEKIYNDTLEKMNISKDERLAYKGLITQRFKHVNEKVFVDVQDGRDELTRLYDRDRERFHKSHFTSADLANQTQLATRMIFSSHSLEKSLSNEKFEIGHGFMVIGLLRGFIDIYLYKGYDKNHKAYINTISVLKAFYERHRGTEYQAEIDDILGDSLLDIIHTDNSDIGGAFFVSISDKKNNSTKNFKDLAEGRFAIRTYANKPVAKKEIEEVIAIATKTPTVCNRQPVRVRVMYDKDIIAKILEVQGGIAYYDTPPVLFLVTADDNSYVGANERNQGYIDGGLFAMSILYALEFKNLAGCPLHAMFETERDFKIRGMLDIPDNEKIITFISAGYFDDNSGVCKSFRYPVDHILTEVKKIHDFSIEVAIPDQQHDSTSVVTQNISTIEQIRMKVRIRTRLRQLRVDAKVRTRVKRSLSKVSRTLDELEYSKADGAILTLTGYFNYGNVIQRYATQKYLRNNGYNFVSYVDPYSSMQDMYRVGRKRRLKTPVRALKRIINAQKPYWYTPPFREIYPESYRLENMINFVNKNIWIKPFDPRDQYKKYIVGSDQTWRNWWSDREILGYYFFNFLKGRKVKRISYAASFGNDKIKDVMSNEDVEYIKPYIESFDHISVREKSGVDLIKKTWGIDDVAEVVDPTLLLDAEEYSQLIESSSVKSEQINPIFTYVLGETPDLLRFVEKIQDERKQPVTSIRAHSGSKDDILPPVELWLKGYRDSELVVTNSFHGMMFSVINNTDFIIIGRESGGLTRIKNFLDAYGISGRFVEETNLADFSMESLEPIDWHSVNKKMKHTRASSGAWLLSAIAK